MPAQECTSLTASYADRINAIFAARKIFSEFENSQRINRALRAKSFPACPTFEQGDQVYYKYKDNRWHGPATVIGLEGKTIVVKQGSFVHRVSPGQVVLIRTGSPEPDSPGDQTNNKVADGNSCLLYTSPSPRDKRQSRMPSSA